MSHRSQNPEQKEGEGLSSGFKSLVEAERLMQIAFVLPSALVICWFLGWWLASHTHQKWLETAGIIFGCIVGLVYVVQMAIAVEKRTSKDDESASEQRKERP
jgi:ATP synthase protein I